MRKKILYLTFVGILLTMLLYSVSAANIVNSDIAYIYKSSDTIDQNIIHIFSDLNLTTDLISENFLSQDLSSYKFILIGEESFSKTVPTDKYSFIIINGNLGPELGLTDSDGISRLASNEPLKVKIDGTTKTIYNSTIDIRGKPLAYYFLDINNKASSMEKYAGVYPTESGPVFGDVISFAKKGSILSNGKKTNGAICFFGIYATDYWTSDAKQMFTDCVNFVLLTNQNQNTTNDTTPGETIKCNTDLECNDNNSSTQDICINPATTNSFCIHNNINSGHAQISSATFSVTKSTAMLSFFVDLRNSSSINGYSISLDREDWIWIPTSDTQYNYTLENLTAGTVYTVYIKVTDSENITSPELSIMFTTLSPPSSTPEPLSESGGGSSSHTGRGSSGCVTEWSCTDWSVCENNTQTRSCGYPPNYCKPTTSKPKEKQPCKITPKNDSTSLASNNTQEEDNIISLFGVPLTGAAIGVLAKKPLTWIVFLIVILVILIIVNLVRQTKASETTKTSKTSNSSNGAKSSKKES